MKLPELKKILKENKVKGYSHLNKPQLIELLEKHNLMPEEEEKPAKPKKEVDPRYERLLGIRKNPKTVVLRDVETGEEHTFKSIYKAGMFVNKSSTALCYYNGRIIDGKYHVTVCD